MEVTLREARKSKGLSMTYMSRKLGYKSVSGYANIEYGITKLSLKNAVKIAKILDMSLSELFFDDKLHNSSKKRLNKEVLSCVN
ncbi:helix-turn-helix transcriptional regulator [Lysinibacillus fusiformis]|uniref:helix-turn-helix transcriptional regulator n=1 Tax=Lysinibacillus fusiformis TaxID=28031 RepID=UPI00187F5C3A|nr:helix-turn-helix transcriptional regulator [Lysinibacillus fusiformis]MBD8521843.1 helix-turn-helix transcriptional regulator [Lysinibacillus fusiformis]